ncbi:MAG: dihydrodipicolinate synthase family protein [Terriglobia bacterium]
MDPVELRSRLKGIVGFGVTPFHQDLSINFEALRQNTAYLVDHCDVVVALGNNGEIFSLSHDEQKQVARAVTGEARGRKPVLVGVGFSLPVTVEHARGLEVAGADGVLVLPPHYSNSSDDGLFEYYRAVAGATRLGVVLFQTPAMNFSPALLRRLAAIPNIVGMKDEHGDMKQFVRQWNAVGDRLKLMCGVGEILAPSYFALGVDVFTSGIINFMPETPHKILRLLQERKFEAAARVVEQDALAIFDLRARRPGYVTAVIKEAMNLCGMNAGPSRPPIAPLLPADREELRAILDRLGVLKA